MVGKYSVKRYFKLKFAIETNDNILIHRPSYPISHGQP